MIFNFKKILFASSVMSLFAAYSFAQSSAAEPAQREYFDCWLEKSTRLVASERTRLGATDDNSAVCGCFKAVDNGPVTQVFGIPKPRVLPCANGSCFQGGAMEQCMDNVRQATFALSDFVDGHPMAGAVPLGFDEGWEMTPFGEYFNKRAARAKDITCFLNVHERPWAPKKKDASVFRISGLPKKLLPEAELRFTDYSDVRCLDNGELTGFAFNGYVENLRHVDAEGLMQGEEIGYMNDPNYPARQGEKWGQIQWTANYKNGMREGNAYYFKSSVADRVPEGKPQYYFKHLEVPYKQGYANGTARMFSDKGFVMADMPVKRGELFGRTIIHNPFKKKKVNVTFAAGNLEGFVDFGDFGGVFHEGLPNGMITFWSVKDSCYEWLPGSAVCYTERLKKKQWGSYKMGKFKGKMECYNGVKGGADLVCSDPVQDSINADPHEIAKKARMTAELAKLDVQKAKEVVQEAQAALQKALDDVKSAEAVAETAEKAAVEAENALKPPEPNCDSILQVRLAQATDSTMANEAAQAVVVDSVVESVIAHCMELAAAKVAADSSANQAAAAAEVAPAESVKDPANIGKKDKKAKAEKATKEKKSTKKK